MHFFFKYTNKIKTKKIVFIRQDGCKIGNEVYLISFALTDDKSV